MDDIKFIKVNKCIVGEVYYLHGGWYDYDFKVGFITDGPSEPKTIPFPIGGNHKPMINSPVKFIGKVNGSFRGGKHRFEFTDKSGKFVHALAGDDMLIEPIENPDILNPEKIEEWKELNKMKK